jgi:hypothetical protein
MYEDRAKEAFKVGRTIDRPIDPLSCPMRGLIARSPRRGEAEILVADDGRNLPRLAVESGGVTCPD